MKINQKDKSTVVKQAAFAHHAAYEATIVVVHDDNLNEFLVKHNATLTPEQIAKTTAQATDTIGIFSEGKLDTIMISPPSSEEVEIIQIANPHLLPERAVNSLIANLYF